MISWNPAPGKTLSSITNMKILHCFIIGIVFLISLINLEPVDADTITYTLDDLKNISDQTISLPAGTTKLEVLVGDAYLTWCHIEDHTAEADSEPPEGIPVFEIPGVKITLFVVYYDEIGDLKVLHKVIIKDNPFQEFLYTGSISGNDLVKDDCTGLSKLTCYLHHGNNFFLGSCTQEPNPADYAENICLTGMGIDCIVGGPKKDKLKSLGGSDIFWGRGGNDEFEILETVDVIVP